MKYHNITKNDMLNGDGLRVVLWVSGCSHYCLGCQNCMTWNPELGLEFDDVAKREIFKELDNSYIDGITFSGGDPLFIGNRNTILSFIKEIKAKYKNKKTIWLYTGYTFEEIKEFDNGIELLSNIDVLLDGEFHIDELSPDKHWVGSYNQRVIDCKKSLKMNEIVLYK